MIITIEDAANELKGYTVEHSCSYEEAWNKYMHFLYTDNYSFEEVLDVVKNGIVLSTGEMLDTIDVDQVAERIFDPEGRCSDRFTKLKIDDDGDLLLYDEQEDDWEYEKLTGAMIRSYWKISNIE